MKAIETHYRGYRFRSRTEARWAVFFQTLGYQWEYEAQGYVLDDGTCYLPDFKLVFADGRIIDAEVKPEEFDDFSDDALQILRALSDGLSCKVILLTGIPGWRAYQQILPHTERNVLSEAFFQDYHPFVQTVDDYWLQTLKFDESTGRMYFNLNERAMRNAFGKGFLDAVKAARGARFEHGETPK